MPANTLFGTAAGQLAFSEDQLLNARAQHEFNQSQAVPANISLMRAHEAYYNAAAAEHQQKVETQKRVAANTAAYFDRLKRGSAAAGVPGDETRDGESKVPDAFKMAYGLGEEVLAAGDFDQGMKIMTQAATGQARVLAGQASKARTEYLTLDAQLKAVKAWKDYFGPANAGNWEYQNAMYEADTGHLSPFRDQTTGQLKPYDAKEHGSFIDGILTAEGKMTTAQRAAKQRMDQADAARKDLDSRSKRSYLKAAEDAARARTEVLRKQGVEDDPKGPEVNAAADLVQGTYDVNRVDARLLGREIADRARGLRKANPALTKAESLKKAFLEMRPTFGMPIRPDLLAKMGNDANNPLPMPTGATPDEVKGKLKAGKYYPTPRGNLKWNGKAFDQPPPVSGAGGGGGTGSDRALEMALTPDIEDIDDDED